MNVQVLVSGPCSSYFSHHSAHEGVSGKRALSRLSAEGSVHLSREGWVVEPCPVYWVRRLPAQWWPVRKSERWMCPHLALSFFPCYSVWAPISWAYTPCVEHVSSLLTWSFVNTGHPEVWLLDGYESSEGYFINY